jgi:hypothetical protein
MKASSVAGVSRGNACQPIASRLCRARGAHARHFGRGFRDACQVQVEEPPERHQLGPRRLLVVLRRHPGVLVVAGKYEVVLKLRAHEALMIVRRRIDQVADDFSRRPFVGCRAASTGVD